jgi:hypothetical protein
MNQTDKFEEFPKMARLSREVIVTEKIDGTNAQICIEFLESCFDLPADRSIIAYTHVDGGRLVIRAGSRSRWINTEDDNFGFARWVLDNCEDLLNLGPGRHFGEWWGRGIQRGYGLTEKRFSLFNTHRWHEERPSCCHVVPIVYQGPFSTVAIDLALSRLKESGSVAAPGFMKPEGVVVFHTAANIGFKKTLEKDEIPKSMQKIAAGA